ncbi:hypothetical protein I4U23_025077 [Adineta vaga]|nr:hypothetical protein I4U23_025077 [Adineta vaga]
MARVLLRQPKILLFDEATSALNSFNERITQRAVDHIQAEDPSRTSIIIAHRLSTILSYSSFTGHRIYANIETFHRLLDIFSTYAKECRVKINIKQSFIQDDRSESTESLMDLHGKRKQLQN